DEQARRLVHDAHRGAELLAILGTRDTKATRGALDLGLRAVGDLAVAETGRDFEAAELARIAQRESPHLILAPGGRSGEAREGRALVLHHVLAAIAVTGLVARVAKQVAVAACGLAAGHRVAQEEAETRILDVRVLGEVLGLRQVDLGDAV